MLGELPASSVNPPIVQVMGPSVSLPVSVRVAVYVVEGLDPDTVNAIPLQVMDGVVTGSDEVNVTVTVSPSFARVVSLGLSDITQYSEVGSVLSITT